MEPIFDTADVIIIVILVGIFLLCLVGLSLYFMHLQSQKSSISNRLDNINHIHTIENALRKILPPSIKLPSEVERENRELQREREAREEAETKDFEYPKKTTYDRQRDTIDDIIERVAHDDAGYQQRSAPPPVRMVPMNIPTRGVEQFQQVGIIASIDNQNDEASTSTRKKILPLYGRRTFNGSSKWNYYTSTDGYHVVQLSVVHKNKDCMEEYGCDELYSDDEIYIQEYEESFRVNMYKRSPIRYIPYV